MSEAIEIIQRAKEIRQRLRRPPNAVVDSGINLRRNRIPPSTIAQKLAVIENQPPCSANVTVTIKPQVQIHNKYIYVGAVLRAVAEYYGVRPADIMGPRRLKEMTHARHVFNYIALRLTRYKTTPQLGRFMGRDHSTILNSKWKIQELIAVDQELAEDIRSIENGLLFGDYDQ